MSKTPNLRQAPTGPVVYPSIVLPPMTSVPFTGNSGVPSRAPSAPTIAPGGGGTGLGRPTNTPNQTR
jgi:hypothetical protein